MSIIFSKFFNLSLLIFLFIAISRAEALNKPATQIAKITEIKEANDDKILEMLIEAVEVENLNEVKILSTRISDINRKIKNPYYKGKTIIHLAALSHKTDMLKFLIEKGGDYTIAGDVGYTPLHLAVEEGYIETVEYLIKIGADIKTITKNNSTLLTTAIIYQNFDIAELLISSGADINKPGSFDNTPLYLACYRANFKLVKLLIQNGADVNLPCGKKKTSYPIIEACRGADIDTIKLFISNGANIKVRTKSNESLMHIAAGRDLSIVKLLYDHGLNLHETDFENTTPLYYASLSGNLDSVKFFIKNNANVNHVDSCGSTPLEYAAMGGNLEVVKYLVQQGADINSQHKATYKPPYPGIIIFDMNTPLMGAVHMSMNPKLDIVKYLYSCGADINLVNSKNETVLFNAVNVYYPEIVKFLLDKGGKDFINHQNNKGWTAFHYSVWHGDLDLVKMFIKARANINIQTKKGYTALHILARENFDNSSTIVDLLLENGVKIDALDKDGKTAAFYARQNKNTKLLKQLQTFSQ